MPRDGHSCTLHDGLMIGFGGDRHHMPFNDLFVLDVCSELEKQSFQFVANRDSAMELSAHGSNQNVAAATQEAPETQPAAAAAATEAPATQ